MQQEAEWDPLGIGTVTADQYQNPADDQSSNTASNSQLCFCPADVVSGVLASKTATLSINVIYDSAANDGKGLTGGEKKAFQAVLERALKDFSGMGINVQVGYSDGSLTVADGKTQVTGVIPASWNVIVSDKTITGSNETGYDPRSNLLITNISTHHLVVSGWYPFSQNSVEHEFSHVVNGDIMRQASVFRQVLGELPIDTTVMLNRWGLSNSFKNAALNVFPFQ